MNFREEQVNKNKTDHNFMISRIFFDEQTTVGDSKGVRCPNAKRKISNPNDEDALFWCLKNYEGGSFTDHHFLVFPHFHLKSKTGWIESFVWYSSIIFCEKVITQTKDNFGKYHEHSASLFSMIKNYSTIF